MNLSESIRITAVLATLGFAIALAGVEPADAQFDHLRCFKIKDHAKFDAQAALTALQTQFGVDEECEIKGKGKLFCVPVQKTVTSFTDKSKDGIPPLVLPGEELNYDRVCYKIKCPKRDISPELISDQFGSRTVEKFKSQLLCTPAIKGLPTTPTTTLPCMPDCTGLDCGDDGCGGSCGTCALGETCNNNGICIPSPMCSEDFGDDTACLAYATEPCTSCCNSDPSDSCAVACGNASNNACLTSGSNTLCAEQMNLAGCASVCCP